MCDVFDISNGFCLAGAGCSKDLSKVKTILAYEVIIAVPLRASNKYLAYLIGPANDPLHCKESLVGPIGPARHLLLARQSQQL